MRGSVALFVSPPGEGRVAGLCVARGKNSFFPNTVRHPLHGVYGRNSGSFSTAARRVAISWCV
jgi:hypothetical protein